MINVVQEKSKKCESDGCVHFSMLEYKDKNYCTWYCAKKESK